MFDERNLFHVVHRLGDVGIFNIEWHEPVGMMVEEPETFHLREPPEIDVGTSLLHTHHFLEALFEFLHPAVGSVGVEDVFHRVVFFLLDTTARYFQMIVFHDFRDDVALYGVLVFFCFFAEHDLFL